MAPHGPGIKPDSDPRPNLSTTNPKAMRSKLISLRDSRRGDSRFAPWSFRDGKKILKNKRLLKIIKINPVINLGSGKEFSIKQFAKMICRLSGKKDNLKYNKKYPDGTMRKILDNKIIKTGEDVYIIPIFVTVVVSPAKNGKAPHTPHPIEPKKSNFLYSFLMT